MLYDTCLIQYMVKIIYSTFFGYKFYIYNSTILTDEIKKLLHFLETRIIENPHSHSDNVHRHLRKENLDKVR